MSSFVSCFPLKKENSRGLPAKDTWVCYIIQSEGSPETRRRLTYVGKTNDMARRLRQHNGEISGGARYTKQRRPWTLLGWIGKFQTNRAVLGFEWRMKHMFKKNVSGGRARLLKAVRILRKYQDRYSGQSLYIQKKYLESFEPSLKKLK